MLSLLHEAVSQLLVPRLVAVASLACLCALPGTAQDPVLRFTESERPITVPLELSGSHVFVQVRVNASRHLWFLLDTGASRISIDQRVAEELELEQLDASRVGGVGAKTVPAARAEGVAVALGTVEVVDQDVTCMSLAMLEPRIGRRVDGILGNAFLKHFVLEIDYRAKRIRLHLPRDFEYEGDGEVVPLRWRGGSPHVVAKVVVHGREPVRGLFLVDTGADMPLGCNRPWTDRHDLLGAIQNKREFRGGYGLGGESTGYAAHVEALWLGELEFKRVLCGFFRDEQGMFVDETYAGIIGGRVLERCRVFLDYWRGQMILERQPGFDAPFTGNRTGLALIAGGAEGARTIAVHRVITGSPGDRAGVREGDVIETVDDRPAAEFTLHTLKRYFRERAAVVLRIRRGDEQLRVELALDR